MPTTSLITSTARRLQIPGRLQLEDQRAHHANEMYQLLADDELWKFTDGGMPESEESLQARYARLETQMSPNGQERWLNWVARDTTANVTVGFVQATISINSTTAAIAYVIGRQYWHRGYGGDAVRLLIDKIESLYAISHIIASVDARNAGSIALLTRLGMNCSDSTKAENQIYLGLLCS